MGNLQERLQAENKAVLSFINDWQSKNEYNPRFLDEYNAKFRAEFNHFLENSNFHTDIVEFFKS